MSTFLAINGRCTLPSLDAPQKQYIYTWFSSLAVCVTVIVYIADVITI